MNYSRMEQLLELHHYNHTQLELFEKIASIEGLRNFKLRFDGNYGSCIYPDSIGSDKRSILAITSEVSTKEFTEQYVLDFLKNNYLDSIERNKNINYRNGKEMGVEFYAGETFETIAKNSRKITHSVYLGFINTYQEPLPELD
jgi:hypothetical protein